MISSKVVAVIRHGAGLIKWTKNKLIPIDRKKRKTMTVQLSWILGGGKTKRRSSTDKKKALHS